MLKLLYGVNPITANPNDILEDTTVANATRFAGIAELKRRYQGVDENLALTMSDDVKEDFESAYFIPTGFAEVLLEDGSLAYLDLEELRTGQIELDLENFRVNILKNTLLYYLEELADQAGGQYLGTLMNITECSSNCVTKDLGENFGTLLAEVIKIQMSEATGDVKALDLIDFYKEICQDTISQEEIIARYRPSPQMSLDRDDIRYFFEFKRRYPGIDITRFKELLNQAGESEIIPYYLDNPDLIVKPDFKKIAEEAYRNNISTTQIRDFYKFRDLFGDQGDLKIPEYRSMINELEVVYIQEVMEPQYNWLHKRYKNKGLKISLIEFFNLKGRLGFEGVIEAIDQVVGEGSETDWQEKAEWTDLQVAMQSLPPSNFAYPTRENQILKAADASENESILYPTIEKPDK